MSLDADALRTSFELVVGRNPDLTLRFYDHLFALHPEARPLFHRSPREAQAKMLAEALAAVLDHLDDAAWLGATLHAMGAKHVGYGVTAPMYGWVGEALLKTLGGAEARAQLAGRGVDAVLDPPAGFRKMLEADLNRWRRVAETGRIRLD